ncbi:hypothetical protein [Halorarum halobium]|uniref:hypothetical protein n=1 Tax=Halorarum halobium TaxID=3075121 RepID=UPI0028ABF22A|nr:hypothetical protein [Halobaculum sp. XH14]
MVLFGAAGLATNTRAFSQVTSNRGADVGVASDEDALLGLDVVPSVESGSGPTRLVTATNNANVDLDVSVSLDDPSQGSLSPQSVVLAPGESASFEVDLAANGPTGVDALPFTIDATNGGVLSITQTRRVDVDSVGVLRRVLEDLTRDTNAEYELSYRVEGVESFGSIEVEFVAGSKSWATESRSSTESAGVLTYWHGGTEGTPYDVVIEVFDASDELVLTETIEDVADGEDPAGNDDLSRPTSPTLEWFTVSDATENDNTEFTVEYEVADLAEYQSVRITFEHTDPDKHWATETKTVTSAPTGTATYTRGGTEGDTYTVIVEVVDDDGLVVDSDTKTVVAGEGDEEDDGGDGDDEEGGAGEDGDDGDDGDDDHDSEDEEEDDDGDDEDDDEDDEDGDDDEDEDDDD